MKLLMIYASSFGYRTAAKGLDSVPDLTQEEHLEDALIGFIQVEERDEDEPSGVETKLVKNLKWAARKNAAELIVLHSFNHLSPSMAGPEFTRKLLDNAEQRLQAADYQTHQTPFGYFLDLDLKAPGTSFARLFKDI